MYEATLDQSNEGTDMVEKEQDFMARLSDLDIRKFCLITAGNLVINTAESNKCAPPSEAIKLARDFYLFMVGEDPVVDAEGLEDDMTNVVPMVKKIEYSH